MTLDSTRPLELSRGHGPVEQRGTDTVSPVGSPGALAGMRMRLTMSRVPGGHTSTKASVTHFINLPVVVQDLCQEGRQACKTFKDFCVDRFPYTEELCSVGPVSLIIVPSDTRGETMAGRQSFLRLARNSSSMAELCERVLLGAPRLAQPLPEPAADHQGATSPGGEMHISCVSLQDTEVKADAILCHLLEAFISQLTDSENRPGFSSSQNRHCQFSGHLHKPEGVIKDLPHAFSHPMLTRATWYENWRNEETEAQSAILQCS